MRGIMGTTTDDLNEVYTTEQVILDEDGYTNGNTLKEGSDTIAMSSAAAKKLTGSVHSYAYTKCVPQTTLNAYVKTIDEKIRPKTDLIYLKTVDILFTTNDSSMFPYKTEKYIERVHINGYFIDNDTLELMYFDINFVLTI